MSRLFKFMAEQVAYEITADTKELSKILNNLKIIKKAIADNAKSIKQTDNAKSIIEIQFKEVLREKKIFLENLQERILGDLELITDVIKAKSHKKKLLEDKYEDFILNMQQEAIRQADSDMLESIIAKIKAEEPLK